MDPTTEFAPLQLDFVDQVHWRYELIRPLVLLVGGTATQRAQDTHTPPDPVRRLIRRFRQQGRLGLLPNDISGARQGRPPRVPEAVRQEIDQLKALYAGFHARELARIVFCTLGYHIDHKTAQKLWQQSPVVTPEPLPRRPSSPHPDRYQARLQVIKLSYQGWDQVSLSRCLPMARTTIDRWIGRFEAEHVAGRLDKKRGPKEPPRNVWLPRMVHVDRLQKAHPDAGECRIWSLLAPPDISVRTVGRMMALNQRVDDDLPHVPQPGRPQPPQPHPSKAQQRHAYGCIDGRQMDVALNGVTWWSLVILEGYSRTILAGAMAPTEATWAALMVLYAACVRYGAPEDLVSDSGGAYTSNAFEAVCGRLEIQPVTIVSTPGERSLNWMETHVHIQRRLYDDQFSLARTPGALDQRHQAFIQTYHTTAHQGLLNDQRLPPIPVEVLGTARAGRMPRMRAQRNSPTRSFPAPPTAMAV